MRAVLAWGAAALVWAGLIFWLSSLPSTSFAAPPFAHSDKLVHFALYLALGALLGTALQLLPLKPVITMIAALVLVGLYGVSDEWHQHYVAGRDSSGFDLLADLAGAATGIALARLVYRRRHADRTSLRGQDSGAG